METFLVRWLVNALALYVTSNLIAGVEIASPGAILLAAVLLGIVNALIRPILLLLTLPLNIATLGLFTFVVNALMLLLVSSGVAGFHIAGFGPALLAAIIMAIVSSLANSLIGNGRS